VSYVQSYKMCSLVTMLQDETKLCDSTVVGKCWQIALNERNLNFYISSRLKCNYDGLKSILGIQIRIRLSLDLFGRILILQGAMAVCSAIFHAGSQIGIRVVDL
jgi:hypothetical protein